MMKCATSSACKKLSSPACVLGLAAAFSALALIAAYTAQFAFGLEPCILCLYQRIPFAIIVALGLIGLALRKKTQIAAVIILLCGAAFLANSGIAFYHTGIEQKWWISAVEGCAVPVLDDDPQTLLDAILKAPTGKCDEIAWKDPVLNLSMANYNFILSLMFFAICMMSCFQILRKS